MDHSFLQFSISFFNKLNLTTNLIPITDPLPPSFDLGLRQAILSSQTPTSIESFIGTAFSQDNTIQLATDKYECHYIFIPIHSDRNISALVIGPYITENASIIKTAELCKTLNIPMGLRQFMHQYFSTLPYIHDESLIETYIDTMAEYLYGAGNYQMNYIRQSTDNDSHFLPNIDAENSEDIMKRLEYRYGLEKTIINSISRGDFNSAMRASNDQALKNIDNRSSNTLRSMKNNLLAFNTVCRKGAEQGGVHPIFLDEMSRQMAIKIENMVSISQDVQIHKEILKKYCVMVQQKSTINYSPSIQRAIIHISQQLFDSTLTLQSTAESLAINKSYLATLFKKETGETFTNYVNNQRIHHAIFLLNTTNEHIQTIAGNCGIPDVTYFTKIFKQKKGMTPSQYRKMITQKDK